MNNMKLLHGDCLEVMKNIEWLKEEILELQNNGNAEANQTEAEREN